jgi:hypothetical protein
MPALSPVHLLRILPAEEMRAKPVEKAQSINNQVNLFDNE